jgi:O-antigen/teichoic acid export membrane protein
MSRVSKNIVFNFIGQGAIVALGFWGTRLVFSRLGAEALGILYFALAIYAVITPIVDLGISSTVVREVASHRENDPEYIVDLVRTGTAFYWTSYVVLTLTVWLAAPLVVSRWISLKSLAPGVATQSLRVLAASLLMMLPRSLYANVVRGVERMELNNAIDVATIALQQVGTIVVVSYGGGLVAISYCYLASFVLNIFVYVAVAQRFVPWRAFLPTLSRVVVSRNLTFTSQVSAYSILSMVQMEADKALISKFLPVSSLGFYGVAQTTIVRVSRLPAAVTQAAFPNFSALFHRGDRTGLLREYRRLQDLVCYGLVPVFAAVVFGAKPLFSYLLNDEASRLLLLPTTLLCLGWYMNTTLTMPAIFALAVGRADIGARQNFYALFLVLPLTAWLIWRWGLEGAGLSCVCYHVYAYAYGARRIASECLEIHPREWYFNVLKTFVLASVSYGLVWLLFGLNSSKERSIILPASAFTIASAAYLCGAYQVIGKELREGVGRWRSRIAGGVLRLTASNS